HIERAGRRVHSDRRGRRPTWCGWHVRWSGGIWCRICRTTRGCRSVWNCHRVGDGWRGGGRARRGCRRGDGRTGYGVRGPGGSGGLGWVHRLRACSLDPSPPPPEYVPTSGGIFRDCAVHDLDGIRYVTGREIVEAYALGANRGEDFFAAAGDADTAAALLTLD